MMKFKCILFITTLSCFQLSLAQNENNIIEDSLIHVEGDRKLDWDMSFTFKTMNVFRGLVPSNAPVFSTQAGIIYGDFILGAYGGASFNGGYTETDLILLYNRPKFNIRLDWYYNFTEGITNIPIASGFFDFDPETTRGLLDFMVDVKLTKNLTLRSSTLLFGRDRPSLPEDDANGILLRRGEQRYSQYFNLQYDWKVGSSKIQAHVGYSYSWNDFSGPSFYGKKPGFTDIGVSFYKKVLDTKTISVPVKASFYVNTVTNNVYLVASVFVIELSKI